MATTPVVVIMWLDPYEQTDFGLGSAVTWHVRFMDRITKVAVDPDVVNMFYSTPLSNSANVTPPVKDGIGNYHVDLPLTAVGRWTLTCQPQSGGANVGMSSTTLQVFDAAA